MYICIQHIYTYLCAFQCVNQSTCGCLYTRTYWFWSSWNIKNYNRYMQWLAVTADFLPIFLQSNMCMLCLLPVWLNITHIQTYINITHPSIPPKRMEHVFKAFFLRVDASNTGGASRLLMQNSWGLVPGGALHRHKARWQEVTLESQAWSRLEWTKALRGSSRCFVLKGTRKFWGCFLFSSWGFFGRWRWCPKVGICGFGEESTIHWNFVDSNSERHSCWVWFIVLGLVLCLVLEGERRPLNQGPITESFPGVWAQGFLVYSPLKNGASKTIYFSFGDGVVFQRLC